MNLLFKVYYIHQRLNNTLTWFPLSWDSNYKRWNCLPFSINTSNFKIYVLANNVFKLILLLSAFLIIKVEFANFGQFGFTSILSQSLMVLAILLSFVADYIVLTHLENLAFACNWTYNIDKYYKISAIEQRLICKVLAVIIVSAFSLAYCSVILFTYLDLDPFSNVSKCVLYLFPEYCNFLAFYQNIMFKLVCLFTYLFMAHFALAGLTNLLVTALSEGVYRRIVLKNLQKQGEPNSFLVRFYRQCQIVGRILKPFEYDASTAVLCTAFVLCLLCSNIIFIALRKHSNFLMVICSGLLIFCIGLLHVVLVIACAYYKYSSKTLAQWKAVTERRQLYLFKTLRSLQIIAMPAGEAGIIDIEIKSNYLHSVILNSTNSILTLRSLI